MATNNSLSITPLHVAKVVVLLAARPTYDAVAAVAALSVIWDNRIHLSFEDDSEIEKLWAHDVLLDLRGYTEKEACRVFRALYALGLDYLLKEDLPGPKGSRVENPRYDQTLNRLVYDLACNNVAGRDPEYPGGWLKDLPLSLVRFIREVWNLLDWYQDREDREYRVDLIEKLARATEYELRPTPNKMSWGEERLDEETRRYLGRLLGPGGEFHQPGRPDGWWWSDHPLTVCGLVRNMFRLARKQAEMDYLVRGMLLMMSHVANTAPSKEFALGQVVRGFHLRGGELCRIIHTRHTRVARRCWGHEDDPAHPPAQILVVRDDRYKTVAILSKPGTMLGKVQQKLGRIEPGRWALLLKIRDRGTGLINPLLLNGGASRQLRPTELTDGQLQSILQDHVQVGDPRRPDGVPWQEPRIHRLRPSRPVGEIKPRVVETIRVAAEKPTELSALTVLGQALERAFGTRRRLDVSDAPEAENIDLQDADAPADDAVE